MRLSLSIKPDYDAESPWNDEEAEGMKFFSNIGRYLCDFNTRDSLRAMVERVEYDDHGNEIEPAEGESPMTKIERLLGDGRASAR